MNTRRRSWQVAAVIAATLCAGILIGRSVLNKDAPQPGSPFVITTTVAEPTQSQRDLAAARRHIRYAVPAAEVFYVDHQTYRGMTLADLHRLDVGVEQVQVVSASATNYCLESTVGAQTVSYVGPGGLIREGRCGDG